MSNFQCECQETTHGHKPGECQNVAKEEDRVCRDCSEQIAIALAGDTQHTAVPPDHPANLRRSDQRWTNKALRHRLSPIIRAGCLPEPPGPLRRYIWMPHPERS
jgi:hypothetical protein